MLSRYGVYAAVLLHKADCAGAFQTADQRQEVTSLARNFVTALKKAPSTESHVCHNYARMLKQLWDRRDRRTSLTARYAYETNTNDSIPDTGITDSEQHHMAQNDDRPNRDNFNNMTHFFVASPMADSVSGGVPSIENYLLGSFMPGVADFSTTDFDTNLAQEYQYMSDFQNWPMSSPGIAPGGQI